MGGVRVSVEGEGLQSSGSVGLQLRRSLTRPLQHAPQKQPTAVLHKIVGPGIVGNTGKTLGLRLVYGAAFCG
ncbi:unnamed protein product [Boreogadus saida]